MKKMNPVVHFEMPAKNRKRMAKFYTNVFGWKTQETGKDMGNYVLAETVKTDKNRMPKTSGAINGGFYQKQKGTSPNPSIVIAVDDVEESMKEIKKAGGKVIGRPVDIPTVGRYVSFKDTEGNWISILQPLNME